MKTEFSTTFEVNKTFRKKVWLPPLTKWRVTGGDSPMAGYVECNLRTKGLIFKHTSPTRMRYVAITKQGLMIVYDGPVRQGYVMNLSTAASVKTKTFRNLHIQMTNVKVKMSYGSFSMLMRGMDALGWLDAIKVVVVGKKHLRGASMPTKMTVMRSEESTMELTKASLRTKEGVLSASSADEVSSKTLVDESQYVSELPSSAVIPIEEDSRSKSLVTVIEVHKPSLSQQKKAAVVLPPFTISEAETTESIRCGLKSVATLRQKLESKSRFSWRKTRDQQRRPTMLDHSLVPSEEMKTPPPRGECCPQYLQKEHRQRQLQRKLPLDA